MNSDHQDKSNLLAIDQLAGFDATLDDLPDTDKKQRRIRYLREALERIGTGKSFRQSFASFFKGMYLSLMPLAIVFLFLPLFFVVWFKKIKGRALVNRRLSRALDYWHIDRHELI